MLVVLLSQVRGDCLLKVDKICKYNVIFMNGLDYFFLPHSLTMTLKFVHYKSFHQCYKSKQTGLKPFECHKPI